MPSDVSRENMTSACTCTKIDLKKQHSSFTTTIYSRGHFTLQTNSFRDVTRVCQNYLNIVYKNDGNLYYIDKYPCSWRCSSSSALMMSLLVPSTDSNESSFDRTSRRSIDRLVTRWLQRDHSGRCVCVDSYWYIPRRYRSHCRWRNNDLVDTDYISRIAFALCIEYTDRRSRVYRNYGMLKHKIIIDYIYIILFQYKVDLGG